MKRGTPRHPKTLALASLLEISRCHAAGVLECLWHFAGAYARRGDVGRHSDGAIAAGIGWDGEPEKLVAALVEAGWLDRCDCHRLRVHDWPEHADQAVSKTKDVTTWGWIECYFDGAPPAHPAPPGRATTDQNRPGKVYFIRSGDDGPIKIGFSANPWARLKTIQSTAPYPCALIGAVDGTPADEAAWHERFHQSRLEGEWFRPDDGLLAAIQKATAELPLEDGSTTDRSPLPRPGIRQTAQDPRHGAQGTGPTADGNGRAGPSPLMDDRPTREREALDLVRAITAQTGKDGAEVFAAASRWRGQSKTRPDVMSDDRLLHTLLALRKWLAELEGRPTGEETTLQEQRLMDGIRAHRRRRQEGATDG